MTRVLSTTERGEKVQCKGGTEGAKQLQNATRKWYLTGFGYRETYSSPSEGLVPEGRSFLQTEQHSSNGSPKGSRHSSSSSTRHKVTLISVKKWQIKTFKFSDTVQTLVKSPTNFLATCIHTPIWSEVRVRKLDEFQNDASELRNPRTNDCTTVNHRALLADKETYTRLSSIKTQLWWGNCYLLLLQRVLQQPLKPGWWLLWPEAL